MIKLLEKFFDYNYIIISPIIFIMPSTTITGNSVIVYDKSRNLYQQGINSSFNQFAFKKHITYRRYLEKIIYQVIKILGTITIMKSMQSCNLRENQKLL